MTTDQLKEHMKFYLSAFNKQKVTISDETIHEDVLSTRSIRPGIPATKEQYRGFVRTSLLLNAEEGKKKKDVDKPWPTDWMKLSVLQLAQSLLPLLMILFFSFKSSAQVNMDLSTVKTELKENAIKIGIHYLQTWDSLFKIQDIFSARKHSLMQLTPSFDIQAGTADAFSSITAKISGMWMFFKTIDVAGAKAVDVTKTWHIVPVSAGIETNAKMNVWNGIFEVGYAPWYQSEAGGSPEWLRNTTLAFFFQTGYKFSKDTAGLIGGEVDQSKEPASSAIVRLKADASANIFNPVTIASFRVGLVGGATVWYDVLNKAVYHRLDGDLRFFVANDDFISLKYQHGSGAPLFNTGDEWGIGLHVTF
jgi:hypothetical protein